jgi:hypothetical protein
MSCILDWLLTLHAHRAYRRRSEYRHRSAPRSQLPDNIYPMW